MFSNRVSVYTFEGFLSNDKNREYSNAEMPKRRSAKTLKEICQKRIALSFDRYWMSHYNEHFQELPRLLYVIGPFESLMGETIQAIINQLIENKCLKRQHFMCLMQESITALDLSKAGNAANNDRVLDSIKARCPKLVSLKIPGLSGISANAISELVKTLPGLRVLNLKQTNCNDQVLSVIGHRCKDLLDLDISITKCTNSGVFSLCQASNQDPNTGCINLLQLKLFGTMINCKGAVHLLRNLVKLQYLGFDDICGAIQLDQFERGMMSELSDFQPGVNYKLRNLFVHGIKVHPVTKSSIELAIRLCPDTVEARLYCGVNNENIVGLTSLDKLVSLDVGNSEGPDLTFEAGLLPVLVEIGHQLRELTVADVNDFDLISIGQQCRNLQKLSILISGHFEYARPVFNPSIGDTNQTLFEKLQHLSVVYPLEEIQTQRNAFKLMLQNAKLLKCITIHYMQTLTSDLLLEVIASNHLNDLEEFHLVSCDNIGPEPIERMIKPGMCLSLNKVDLKSCHSITMQDYEKFKSIIKRNRYSIDITWT